MDNISFSQGFPAICNSWEMRNCDIRAESVGNESLEASQGWIIYPFSQGFPTICNSWEMRKCDTRVKSDQKESLEESRGRIYAFSRGVPAIIVGR